MTGHGCNLKLNAGFPLLQLTTLIGQFLTVSEDCERLPTPDELEFVVLYSVFIESPTLWRELEKFLVELVADLRPNSTSHSGLLASYVSVKKYVDVCLR